MSSSAAPRFADPQESKAAIDDHLFAPDDLVRNRSARAVQKISALGEMTGGIAHDFRNILAIVAGGLRVAEDNAGDPAKLAAALAAARDGVERGTRMISRLLAFASQHELKAGPEDVNAVLEKLRMFLEYGAGSGNNLILDLASDLPKCLVDPPQFNAAILNLVVNARDAMPEGGTIRISTTAIRGMRLGRPCNYVRVQVRDQGTGMPTEIIERVFDPYFTTKGDSGSGLGVPQVQALMRQVGGYVTVDSEVDRGTSFDLFFPAQDEEPAPALDAWRQLDRWTDEGGAIVASRAATAA
jgi:signal transduction histidine kinase